MPGLNVNISGKPDGPAILFIHGLGGNSTNFFPVIRQAQLGETYKTLTFDLEGFGLSPLSDKAVTMDSYVDNVKDVLDGAGVDKAVIVGHSMGGLVAMYFAARYPTRLTKLFLLSPVRQMPDRPFPVLVQMAAQVRALKSVAPLAEAIAFGSTATRSHADPLKVYCAATSLASTPYEGYAAGCDMLSVVPDPNFAAIRAPTLVVRGEEGETCTPAVLEVLKAGIAGVRVVTVEGGGHWGMFEQLDDVVKHLKAFLAE